MATAEQICPSHPGGAPDRDGAIQLSGDAWVAFAGDPGGVDNAWMQVGDQRPTLTCYSHHSGQDGHDSPPSWGEDSNIHPWMGWVVCADPCGSGSCCGLEVLSTDHSSGASGQYFNFVADAGCQAPGEVFEVTQSRGGQVVWSGEVTY